MCVADKCNVNHWYSGVIGFVFITHSTQETERKAYSVLVKSTTSIYLSSCHCYNIIGIINVHWPKSSPSLSSAVLCRHNRVLCATWISKFVVFFWRRRVSQSVTREIAVLLCVIIAHRLCDTNNSPFSWHSLDLLLKLQL